MNPLDPRGLALHTDLAEVASAAALQTAGRTERATLEVSLGALPSGYGYVVASGLDQVSHYLREYRFEAEQIQFLRNLFIFHAVPPEFWEWLATCDFDGDLLAAPEGTPVFPGEPFMQLTAPLPIVQLVRPYIASIVAYESMVATSAARLVQAAAGREVVEAGDHLTPGPGAAILAARAAYIAGAAGTTGAAGARELGIPIYNTMPEPFLRAHDTADAAYRAFHQSFPTAMTLLLDPLDPLASARTVASLDLPVRSVRIEGGEPGPLSHAVRATLDAAGKQKVKIAVSGGLDEPTITALVAANCPIDQFHVGRQLAYPIGAAPLRIAIDLVATECAGELVARGPHRSRALAGKKQVYRHFAADGVARKDVVACSSETGSGAPLLLPSIRAGKMADGRPGVETVRAYTARALARLPVGVRSLIDPSTYPVTLSDQLSNTGGQSNINQPPASSPTLANPGDQ